MAVDILECSFDSIVFKKNKENNCSYIKHKKFVVEYTKPAILVHELAHVAFTDFDRIEADIVVNAVEDYRVNFLLQQIKPVLYDVFFKEERKIAGKLIEKSNNLSRNEKILLSTAASKELKQELFDKFKLKKKDRVEISQACQQLEQDQSLLSLDLAIKRIRDILDKQKSHVKRGLIIGADSCEKGKKRLGDDNDTEKIYITESEWSRFDKNLKFQDQNTDITIKPSEIDKFKLIESLKYIVRKKNINRSGYAMSGKLDMSRLGKLPSRFIFSRKSKSSSETALFMLLDLSGSMIGERLSVVVTMLEALQSINVPKLDIQIRAFNKKYFLQDQIGKTSEDIIESNIDVYNGRYTNDAFAIQQISKEIAFCGAPNKYLFLITDGYSNPSPEYANLCLPDIVKQVPCPFFVFGIQVEDENNAYENFYFVEQCNQISETIRKHVINLIS